MCIHFILCFADHPMARRENRISSHAPIFPQYFAGEFFHRSHLYCHTTRFQVLHPVNRGSIYFAATIYFLAILFWRYISAGRHRSAGMIPKGSQVLSVSDSYSIRFGSQSVVILPLLEFLPNMVFIGIVLFSVAITYAILKYGLFILTLKLLQQISSRPCRTDFSSPTWMGG